jgi:uncharacterized protein (TIGR02444 family)
VANEDGLLTGGGDRGGLRDNDLWNFSLHFYALPGVAPALIALQDRDGRDVNLILYALWLGLSGRGRLDAAALQVAASAIEPLRHGVVEPLRELRRRLKEHPDPEVQRLRERVKALELEGEETIQRRLAGLAGRPSAAADPAAAESNLALCLGPAAGSAEASVLRTALAAQARRQRGFERSGR